MDVLTLSRLQFFVATFFHFFFVPLTLGLSIMLAVMETRYARTGDQTYYRMTRFWGKLFLINFAVGVVTGLTLEFQFGTNWSRYSEFMGDIFGSLLAIEALGFFFLESIMIGVWIFGWNKISPKAHAFVMWLIAFASGGSAVWILTANSWMQHPVGYVIRNGRAELASFFEVATNKFAILMLMHTTAAAYVVAAFFIMGISGYHLIRRQHMDVFKPSFRIAAVFAVIFSLFVAFEGHFHAEDLAVTQPAKLAALEAHWETGPKAPIYLLAVPDTEQEKNSVQIGSIPGLLSIMAFGDPNAVVKGLKDFPKDERPPVFLTFLAFKFMVGLGVLLIVLSLFAWWKRNTIEQYSGFLKLMLWAIPLPYIVCQLGWIVAEVGRQPWIVYGLMKTSDAVSPIAVSQAATSLVAFILGYGLLAAVAGYLMVSTIKKGPAPVAKKASR